MDRTVKGKGPRLGKNLGDRKTRRHSPRVAHIIKGTSARTGPIIDGYVVETSVINPGHRLPLGNGDRRRVENIGETLADSNKSRRGLTKRFTRDAE